MIKSEKGYRYYNLEKDRIVSLIPDGPNVVMDIGCAAGRLGRRLRYLNKASELVGVELFKPAADEAAKIYNKIYQGDIEQMNLSYENYFDIIFCGDILEHLRDPWKMVENIYNWLKKDGVFISSVPNIRYWRILRDLIFYGIWKYAKVGVLDSTHLRFFTRRTFLEMIETENFSIVREQILVHGNKSNLINKLTNRIFEEFLGSQILVISKKVKCSLSHYHRPSW